MSRGPDACKLGAQKEITKIARRQQKDFFIGTTRSENGVQGKQLRLAVRMAQGKLRDIVQNKSLKHGGTEAAEYEFKSLFAHS
jgi:hypothetical protein